MGQSRAEKPILIDQNLKFQISRLGAAWLAVVRCWTARRHHLCGAANVNNHSSLGDRLVDISGYVARVYSSGLGLSGPILYFLCCEVI